ncbi:hypothetical protein R3P38DRAFT_2865025 [Favolaschia claudopus]|uniref:Uncharacterized protein n=1 Tax=Favolaschia claudopus TaxID=2862362 RepID=A0AAW0DCF7_9AGAR
MFNNKIFLAFSTVAGLLSSAAGQSDAWEVEFYVRSAGDTGHCTGGGSTISGSDFICHTIGLGSNVASFQVLRVTEPFGFNVAFHVFSDNSCQNDLGAAALGPGACFSDSVGSFQPFLIRTG